MMTWGGEGRACTHIPVFGYVPASEYQACMSCVSLLMIYLLARCICLIFYFIYFFGVLMYELNNNDSNNNNGLRNCFDSRYQVARSESATLMTEPWLFQRLYVYIHS